MSDSEHLSRSATSQPNVYERFVEEMVALTIKADDPVAEVVGELTRAVKRAQLVVDGELATVATRKVRAKEYADKLNAQLRGKS